jgi:hypothetical protein
LEVNRRKTVKWITQWSTRRDNHRNHSTRVRTTPLQTPALSNRTVSTSAEGFKDTFFTGFKKLLSFSLSALLRKRLIPWLAAVGDYWLCSAAAAPMCSCSEWRQTQD